MKSLCLGTVFSGLDLMVTVDNDIVPKLFTDIYLTTVPNEKFGHMPFASGIRVISYVVIRGTFESGFKTYGPYQGQSAAMQAGYDIAKKFAPVAVKMGTLPTWTSADDEILVELGMPALLADVSPEETQANMKAIAIGLRKLVAKKDPWAKHLYEILTRLMTYAGAR